jgi:hypothetical protein
MQDYWAVRQKLYIQSAGPSLSQPREQLRFLILGHGGYFTGSHQCPAALSTNGERAELVDGEERLIFMKLGENALDVVYFFPVFRIG